MADLATGPSPRDRTLHLTPLVMDVGRTTDPPATAAGLETLHRVSAEETSTVMTVLYLRFPPISAVVDPEVDAISAVHPDVTASSMSGKRSLKSIAMDHRERVRGHQRLPLRETATGVRRWATGLRQTSTAAVHLTDRRQSDRPSPSGQFRTQVTDGQRTAAVEPANSTLPKYFYNSSFYPSRAAPAPVTTPLLSRFINAEVPALMMLPSTISEGMAPNITVTVHSVQTPMMLDSGSEVSVLPLDLVRQFDPPIDIPISSREVRTFGNSTVTF